MSNIKSSKSAEFEIKLTEGATEAQKQTLVDAIIAIEQVCKWFNPVGVITRDS